MDERRKTREQAYLHLLKWGLLYLRDAAFDGRVDICQVESDHLHNIPTLLDETNEHRHVYYIECERGLYLERLRTLGAVEYLQMTTGRYGESWIALASVVGLQLSD